MLSVCVCVSPLTNFWMAELIFMKFGIYIVGPEPTSTAYIVSPSHHYVSIYIYIPLSLVGNCSVKCYRGNEYTRNNGTVVRVVYMRSVSYQSKVGN
jgi:hypothetical protein